MEYPSVKEIWLNRKMRLPVLSTYLMRREDYSEIWEEKPLLLRCK